MLCGKFRAPFWTKFQPSDFVTAFITAAAALLLLAVASIAAVWKRRAEHDKLFNTPLPETWRKAIEKNLPIAAKLNPEQRRKLNGYIQLFLADKVFEGQGGLEITDEIKVTVAAQACMLLIGRDTEVYPRLKTIILYPGTYKSGRKGLFGGDNGPEARLGESWDCGVVVLAWNSVLRGAHNIVDGHNVVFHEFAHQLDQEDGAADGAPILEERSAYSAWAKVCSSEFEELVNDAELGRKSVMDKYGATNPAEFFAVATETFFEQPKQLSGNHPELYEELKAYYKLDPLQWN